MPRSGPTSWNREAAYNGEEWDDAKHAAVLAEQMKEATLLAGLLAARGMTQPEEALSFLAGEDSLSDPLPDAGHGQGGGPHPAGAGTRGDHRRVRRL